MTKVIAALIVLAPWAALAQPGAAGGQSPELARYSLQHSGAVDPMGATFAITFDRAVAATYESEIGGVVLDVAGSPERVTDGTWPAGLSGSQGYGWTFDGSTDYLSITDAASDGAFDSAGDWFIFAFVTPSTVAAGEDCIVGKWETTGNQRSWKLCRDAATVVLSLSVDGTVTTTLTKTAALAQDRPACIVATYDQSTTTAAIYVDELTAATSAAMSASIFDSTAPFEVGASDTGATLWAGRKGHVEVGPVLWTADQARAKCRQYRGLLSAAGVPVDITSATPPAIMIAPPDSGTEPFLVSQPVNTMQVTAHGGGLGGIGGRSAVDNLFHRGLLRTWAGAHATCGDCPTGLACYCSAGDGTAALAPDTTTMAVDSTSAKLTLTGTTSYSTVISSCLTAEIGQNLRFGTRAICKSGTCGWRVELREFTAAADCSGAYISTNTDCTTSSSWKDCPATFAAGSWNGATQSYKVYLWEMGNGGVTSNFDAPYIYAHATNMPTPIDHYCGADTDATASCSTIVASTASPLLSHANGETQVDFVASSPWAGTALAADAYLLTDGTALAANTLSLYVDSANDEPGWVVSDATPADKTVETNVADWSAGTDYSLKARFDGAGNMGLYWNSAWATTTGGAGTGLRSAGQTTLNLCPGDCSIHDLVLYRRIMP